MDHPCDSCCLDWNHCPGESKCGYVVDYKIAKYAKMAKLVSEKTGHPSGCECTKCALVRVMS